MQCMSSFAYYYSFFFSLYGTDKKNCIHVTWQLNVENFINMVRYVNNIFALLPINLIITVIVVSVKFIKHLA